MTPKSGELANETYKQLQIQLGLIYLSLNNEPGTSQQRLEQTQKFHLLCSCVRLAREDSDSWRQVDGWPQIYARTGNVLSMSSRLSSVQSLKKSFLLSKTLLIGLSPVVFVLGLVVALWQGFSQPFLWALL